MAIQTIDGDTAWRTVAGAKHLRWSSTNFSQQVYPVRHRPKFTLAADDKVFCIGSCFARNVEEHLAYQGMTVSSQRIISPAAEFGARPAGLVNKYTTFSMLNELEWIIRPPELGPELFSEDGSGQWFDLQLSDGAKPVSLERAIERRRYLTGDYFARLRQADVVILTLGLVEAWRDATTGLHLNAPPSAGSVARYPGRFTLEVTDYEQNLAALRDIHGRLKEINPKLRMIVTVSPIPLSISFTGTDPVVANSLSKSMLRVVAQTVSAHPDIDYYPSYEMVTSAPRAEAFAWDCRHALDSTVEKVIGSFLTDYVGRSAAANPGFTELGYLTANPDVDTAVRAGNWDSGFHHWQTVGKSEGRPLMPPGGPTPRMIRAGAG